MFFILSVYLLRIQMCVFLFCFFLLFFIWNTRYCGIGYTTCLPWFWLWKYSDTYSSYKPPGRAGEMSSFLQCTARSTLSSYLCRRGGVRINDLVKKTDERCIWEERKKVMSPSYTLLLSNLKCTQRVEGYRKWVRFLNNKARLTK